jgi:hypothetical protein
MMLIPADVDVTVFPDPDVDFQNDYRYSGF